MSICVYHSGYMGFKLQQPMATSDILQVRLIILKDVMHYDPIPSVIEITNLFLEIFTSSLQLIIFVSVVCSIFHFTDHYFQVSEALSQGMSSFQIFQLQWIVATP